MDVPGEWGAAAVSEPGSSVASIGKEEEEAAPVGYGSEYPVFGDVFAWGTHTDGVVEPVPSCQGLRLTRVSGNLTSADITAIAPEAPDSRTRWIVHNESATFAGASEETVSEVGQSMLASRLSRGGTHAAMTTEDGSAFVWGGNAVGQLGLGNMLPEEEPALVLHLEKQVIVQAACGDKHTVFVSNVGDVFTCGSTQQGQLGLGYRSKKAVGRAGMAANFQPVPRYISSLVGVPVSSVACGACHTVALTAAGAIMAWGEGGCGQLGIGRVTKTDIPALVMESDPADGSTFVQAACGYAHTLVRSRSGNVWVWGLNVKGQLGLGDTTSRYTPELLQEQDLAQSKDHRRTLAEAGRIGSASDVRFRQFGPARVLGGGVSKSDGNPNSPPTGGDAGASALARPRTPLDVAAAEEAGNAERVSAASYLAASVRMNHSIATLKPEEVPPTIQSSVTVPPPMAQWGPSTRRLTAVSIAAGPFHSAAVTPGGEVFTWGSAEGGRLGHADRNFAVMNGDIETTLLINATYPKRVLGLAERRATVVACSKDATAVVVEPELERMHPLNGYTSGNTTVNLYGVGLAGLARPGEAKADPGSAIPGVYIRFTRHKRDPSVHEDEDEEDDASLDSAYLRELEELVCPCDVEVQIIVDGDLVVRGSMAYAFYDPPKLHTVTPDLVRLAGGDAVVVHGDGLFGCMLADAGWKDVAKDFMAAVDAKQAADAKKKAKKPKKGQGKEEEMVATRPEPSPLSKLVVRFTMYCDGEPVESSTPVLAPGRYIARFEEDKKEEEDLSNPFGDMDDYDDDDEGGTFSASVACDMPNVPIPADIQKRLVEGERLALEFMVQLAISGDDFIPGKLVNAFAAGVLDSSPPEAPIVGGTRVVLDGYGFRDVPELQVRLRIDNPPLEWIVPASYESPGRISFLTPEMKLPIPGDGVAAASEGKEDSSGDMSASAGAGAGAGAGAVDDDEPAAAVEGGGDAMAGTAAAADDAGTPLPSASDGDGKAQDGSAEGTSSEGKEAVNSNEEKAGDAADAAPAPAEPAPAPKPKPTPKPKPKGKKGKKKKPPQHPTFGSGTVFIDVAVREGDFFSSGRSLVAYAGDIVSSTPDLGLVSGGTVVTLSPPEEQAGWLFPSSNLLVKVFNDDFAFILPGELNMNVGTISLAMPPLPQPPVTEEESKGGAEDGQEVAAEKEEEEQQGENAPARSRRASAVSRASAADGDREGSAVGPMVSSQPVPACVIDHVEVSQAVNRHVSLMVTLDGLYWLPQTFPFEYYDPAESTLVDATPAQVVVGDDVTLIGTGWGVAASRPVLVRVRTEEEGAKVVEAGSASLVNPDEEVEDPSTRQWKVVFTAPVITPPPPPSDEEDTKKKKKAKAKVRPVWFDLSFDGGAAWFSAADGVDVHIQVKDPPPS